MGLSASLVLLVMLLIEFLQPGLHIPDRTIDLLVTLIGLTILVDILLEKLPVNVSIESVRGEDE